MATSNKSKKILEKARKVAAKTKKKKVSKVDVKKKTTSYPEGQNAPQSKRYTQEADKSLGAKNTGWRWTKEGAKKLGKDANAKPSQSDIETYRNETFKLKGKPNKSGPKGVGDGSHRYLYIERRADKADIKRSQKLAKGGEIELEIKNLDSFDKHYDEVEFTEEELSLPYQKDGKWFVKTSDKGIAKQLKQDGFVKDSFAKGGYMANGGELNVHHHDFKANFTIEWDVKNVGSNANISEDDWEYEYTSGTFTNVYAQRCFDEIKSKVKPKDWHIEDWSFAGRSHGWFALICYGDKNDVTDSQMDKMNSIVDKYSKNYSKELEEFYNPKNKSYAKGGVTKKQFSEGDMVYVISYQQPFKNYFAEVVSVGEKFSKVEDEEGLVHIVDNNQIQKDIYDFAKGGVVSKQNVQKLLKAVEKDWGQGSELYGDLQESIIGWQNRQGELNPQGVSAVKHLLYNWDCYDEYEKYLNSSYAKGGITKDELKEFKSYVKSYYGKGEIYEEFFPPIGASNDEIELAIRMYVSYCKTKDDQWGGGDTFDREFVRDVMLYNRGQKTNLEYQRAVKEIVKHYKNKSFEYGGILQPMIGGVNADPRFDIYNTTMFAKDGAELPKGEKMRRGGFVTTMDDLIASADLIGEAEAKMKEGDFDQVLNFAYTDYGGDFFDKVAIEFFLENYPDNIVVENTMYSGKNAIVFGKPARKFAEASERYLLGFDNIEDYYYQMQYEQEREDFERFLDDMEKYNNYKVSKEALDWLLENKSGYYSILPSGLDYSESDLEEELVNEGLLEKNEEMAKGGETKDGKIVKRRYLQGRGKNVFTFGYGMPKDSYDMFGTKGGTEYFIMPNGKVYKKTKENMNLFEFIGTQDDYAKGGEMARGGVFEVGRFYKAKDGKNYRFLGSKYFMGVDGQYKKLEVDDFYAKGGKTKEQGYDDREDESLAMRHGKISSKDFVGSHHKKEHSRRDDARFETRDK